MPRTPPTHKPARAQTGDGRPSAARRGYDPLWRKVRLIYLHANPLCVRCGAVATVVDHVHALTAGGDRLDPANLQSLCHTCHNVKGLQCDGLLGRPKKQG